MQDVAAKSAPPMPDFPFYDEHPNAEAHRWIAETLPQVLPEALRANAYRPDIDALLSRVETLPPSARIAVLRAGVEQLPWLRANSASWKDENGEKGVVLYELVCRLYKRKLPYAEADICDILRSSRHGCGHGGDVTPPVDILLAYVRKHGVTPPLLDALREFLAGLKHVTSAKASLLKPKASVILLLDLDVPAGKGAKACWSDGLRQGLRSLPRKESMQWQDLILHVGVHNQVQTPRSWTIKAQSFLDEYGAAHTASRLREWWPENKTVSRSRFKPGAAMF